jgi:RNA polymerase sigma-54 factor
VLSDDAIVDILKKEGIDIARRTVAKYREAMNIPSSVQRRREKRARASAA